MRAPIVLAVLLPVAGCVSAPAVAPPPPSVRPAPPPPAPAPRGADWRDWPPTPGTWRYGSSGGQPAATFGTPGAADTLKLSCERPTRRILLSVSGVSDAALTVRTSSASRTLALSATRAASLAANDPLLDAIAFSRGRFVVEQPGAVPLVLPAWAEIGRVVEDCRG